MRKSFLSLMTVMLVCVAQAATIKWYDDAPHRTPTDPMVVSVQTNGPNGYGYVLMSDMKSYVSNSIGGAFIANNGGEGTNTVLRGNTLITKAYGDGSGLTNLPSTGGSQVWTNDGTFTWLSGLPAPDTNGVMAGPPFSFRDSDGSLCIGTNFAGLGSPSLNVLYPIFSSTFSASNEPSHQTISMTVSDSVDQYYYASIIADSYIANVGGVGDGTSVLRLDGSGETNWATISATASFSPAATLLLVSQHGSEKFTVDGFGNVAAAGVFTGDGSGLTNLNNVIETNVYQTFNVKNLTVQSNLFFFQSRPQVIAWSGPTNTLDFSLGQVFTYSTLVPVSITNIIGITNGYQNASLLWLTNTSSTNIAITLPTGWKTGRGDATTCTNGGVFQVWPAEASGMRTIATKEYP